MEMWRKISAFLLSAVFLPTLLLTALHRHQPETEADSSVCAGCESHTPHSHLSDVHQTDECLVCQFLTVLWLPSDGRKPVGPDSGFTILSDSFGTHLAGVSVPGQSTRAPPYVFFLA